MIEKAQTGLKGRTARNLLTKRDRQTGLNYVKQTQANNVVAGKCMKFLRATHVQHLQKKLAF